MSEFCLIHLPQHASEGRPAMARANWCMEIVSSEVMSLTTLAKEAKVGIIGGVSADMTVDFVNKLVKWSNEGKDEQKGATLMFFVQIQWF
ncbi:hypothetical protein Tco_1428839 [Tanacetum coccineum]